MKWGGREGVGEAHGVQGDDKQTQDEESEDEKRKQSEDERCNHTGTPIFGLPPVPFGVVADFICGVYALSAPMTLHWAPLWVLFHPWSQQ